MANRWTEWVKKWASDNNTTYGCALSNPKCKEEYRAKYGNRKQLSSKRETELMGDEDRPQVTEEKEDLHRLIKTIASSIKSSFKEDPSEVNTITNAVVKTLLGYTQFKTALDKIRYMIYQSDNKGLKAKILQEFLKEMNRFLEEGETKRVERTKLWLKLVSEKLNEMSPRKLDSYRKKLYNKFGIDSFKEPISKEKFISTLKILSGANESVFNELNKLK
jgi:hypothetical protein